MEVSIFFIGLLTGFAFSRFTDDPYVLHADWKELDHYKRFSEFYQHLLRRVDATIMYDTDETAMKVKAVLSQAKEVTNKFEIPYWDILKNK